MKTFVIFVLSAALLAVAGLTRPTESGFKDYLIQSRAALQLGTTGSPAKGAAEKEADPEVVRRYLAQCTFADRLLWVDVKREGRTVYTGVFSHWVAHSADPLAEARK